MREGKPFGRANKWVLSRLVESQGTSPESAGSGHKSTRTATYRVLTSQQRKFRLRILPIFGLLSFFGILAI